MTNPPSTKSKRQAAQQTALEREQRQRTIRIGAIVIIAVAALGALIYWVASETIKGQNEWTIRPTQDPDDQTLADEGRNHVDEGTPLTFQHFPPSSGSHYPTPAGTGFYEQEFSEGYWVHSLEHGFVVILYNCAATDNCDALKSQIKGFISSAPTHGCDSVRLIGLPYSKGMSTPVTLISWNHQLDLPAFDATRVMNFYKRYDNRGPENLGCP
jgi:Protein of unknown function (DUF3105)